MRVKIATQRRVYKNLTPGEVLTYSTMAMTMISFSTLFLAQILFTSSSYWRNSRWLDRPISSDIIIYYKTCSVQDTRTREHATGTHGSEFRRSNFQRITMGQQYTRLTTKPAAVAAVPAGNNNNVNPSPVPSAQANGTGNADQPQTQINGAPAAGAPAADAPLAVPTDSNQGVADPKQEYKKLCSQSPCQVLGLGPTFWTSNPSLVEARPAGGDASQPATDNGEEERGIKRGAESDPASAQSVNELIPPKKVANDENGVSRQDGDAAAPANNEEGQEADEEESGDDESDDEENVPTDNGNGEGNLLVAPPANKPPEGGADPGAGAGSGTAAAANPEVLFNKPPADKN